MSPHGMGPTGPNDVGPSILKLQDLEQFRPPLAPLLPQELQLRATMVLQQMKPKHPKRCQTGPKSTPAHVNKRARQGMNDEPIEHHHRQWADT